jgi:hypothetical protein
MMDGIEPDQSDDNEINRDNNVQKPGHDQDENSGDQGDQRRDMGGGEDHGVTLGLQYFSGIRDGLGEKSAGW